jgi:hypothetical protein
MTDSTEVAETTGAGVPALVSTPAIEIDAGDVALPRVYIGQYSSDQVVDKRVEFGDIFTALGQDDPAPNVVHNVDTEDGVLLHVLGLRKGKSLSQDGELELFAFDDPNAPPEAWVTYQYVVALPEVDQELPFKMLWTRSATPAAKQVNLVLAKNASRGPAWLNAFRVTTAFRSNEKGRWYVPIVRPVDADPEHVELCESLAALAADTPQDTEFASGGDDPAI